VVTAGAPIAAFKPAQHVARQQVARTSNFLRARSNMLRAKKLLVACTMLLQATVARNKQFVAAQHVALV